VDALHLGGLIAFRQGNAETAANLVWKAIQCEPAFLDAYLNLGRIFQSMGRETDAEACFRKALELDPQNAEARALLGEPAPPAGGEAPDDGRRTMSIHDAIHFAAEAHRAGNFSDAEKVYHAILEVEPDNSDALHLLGVLHVQQGRHAEGIALIERAVRLSPRGEMYRNLGQAYLDSGDAGAAEECFHKARELAS
jgi:tetratricopeptide (TPR) repeat protein